MHDLLKFPLMALSTVVLVACAVGPEHLTPAAPAGMPERFARAASDTSPTPAVETAVDSMADGAAFWRAFQDPQLSALIDRALLANHDLKQALARYDNASALLREARFDQVPTVSANASASHARRSQDEAAGQPRSSDGFGARIQASWELDFFGRVRRHVEAQGADAAAAAADLAALRLAIVGEVASAYAGLRGLQERLRIAQENAGVQRATLQLVAARLVGGRGTEFDAARARAQLDNTASRVPALQAQIAVAQHRLAVLTGRTPDALISELDPSQPLPVLPPNVDVGTPAALLRRRPDVRAAELRLHAATARVGVATADLFPRLSLGGMLGSFAFRGSALFKSGSESNSAVLGIDWSFLDAGRVRARIAASEAGAQEALAAYQQTVLGALENVENALVRYGRTREEESHLAQASHDSEIAARLARVRLEAGNIGLYEALDAQREQLSAQDAFADSRMRSVRAAVALHQALAGGWPARADSDDHTLASKFKEEPSHAN